MRDRHRIRIDTLYYTNLVLTAAGFENAGQICPFVQSNGTDPTPDDGLAELRDREQHESERETNSKHAI